MKIDDSSPDHAADPEAEASSIGREKQVGAIFGDDANHLQYQQLHDELSDQLSDFGDDRAPVASPKGVVSRRKLRVIDFEDDE